MLDHAPFVTQERTAAAIDAAVSDALQLRDTGADASAADPLRHALTRVFTHYCAVLTERLNAAPVAHLAAFVEMLDMGPNGREPATPAYAPLAFKAAQAGEGAPVPVVPKFTEVAAPGSGGRPQPVVFQTTADLEVLRAEAVRAMWVDAHAGTLADASAVVSPQGLGDGESLRSHGQPFVRAMHIGHRAFFCSPDLAGFSLDVRIARAQAPIEPLSLQWGMCGPDGFVQLDPSSDTTHGFTTSGTVVFSVPSPWQASKLHGVENGWLTCRLRASANAPGIGSSTITGLAISADRALTGATLDTALSNRVPVDLTRDFYPFGERPRFNDVLYLASKAFAVAGARVVLTIELTNPADAAPGASPIPPVSRDGAPRVSWEAHTASGWRPVSVDDGTDAFTKSGTVSFAVPADAIPATINGAAEGWLRARLASGNYRVSATSAENFAVPMDAPPSIARIGLAMSLHAGPLAPQEIIVENGLTWERLAVDETGERAAFQPFPSLDQTARALYIGLRALPEQLAGHNLSLYVGMAQHGARAIYRDDDVSGHGGDKPRWQVSNGEGWRDCESIDMTGGFRHPGYVQVTIAHGGIAPWHDTLLDADHALLWLRVLFDTADDAPPIRQIVLNVVPAVQALRFEDELLGSATERPAQTFRTARAPVVGEVRVEVREAYTGSARDWVRWNRVDDFAASARDARDFVLDRTTGTLRFGDGRRARMPPAGGNNVRISYSAGGGVQGNQPPLAITQLRTTVPYVASAQNCDWASGGQDAPDDHAARRASLARVRHRGRAVCRDDYADLALGASPEIARAACIGGRDVSTGDARGQAAPGVVSVTVVPCGTDRAPQPTLALLAAVKRYLEARAPAGVELILAGPVYVQVCVDAELAVAADASPERLRIACAARFDAYLHPLTGGDAGHGWRFGVEPHASDLLACLDAIDGIEAVRALRLRFIEPAPGVRARGDFLICAGGHIILAGR
ncbi:putative baseplate assembly protein [Paraburkholderia sp. MMS20-SJTN17]|uniref:Baseplate assembly protein n=1 Tax=Paraburkholderia translucens TaxID=2886945 RepID=A0ABS8K6V3_9BURK|nr:putative baseplate assembly protein [Paraburkholderia sp. MMS20-SJTN17]MCC8400468.1 putative baseplate assembly protein [Paraburkholderia sp. MMS20-SJTN17]